jgi:hypothetical protein
MHVSSSECFATAELINRPKVGGRRGDSVRGLRANQPFDKGVQKKSNVSPGTHLRAEFKELLERSHIASV